MPQDKPTVSINLDKLEREGDPGDFSVVLGGNRYVFIDTQQLDYRDLTMALVSHMNGNSRSLLELIIPENKREAFFANRLPVFKVTELLTAYMSHYGIDPGEAPASSPS